MKKPVRIALKVVAWIAGVVVALIVLLPLWIGPVVRGVANSVVPGITGTPFHLGCFSLNQYTGVLKVGDMQLGSPEGYDEKESVNLGSLEVDLAMTSLPTKKIRVESVALDGLTVYVAADAGNFTKIAENASGGEKADKTEAEKPAEEKPAAAEKSDEGGKKVQIDLITLRNVKIKYGLVTLPVPDLTLKDIGKESEDGASFADVWEKVKTAVLESVGCVGGKLSDLGKGALELGKNGAAAAAEHAQNLGNAAAEQAQKLGGAAKDLGSSAADAASKGVDAIKGLFK